MARRSRGALGPDLLLRGTADNSAGTLTSLVNLPLNGSYGARVFAGDYDIVYDHPDTLGTCTGATFPCYTNIGGGAASGSRRAAPSTSICEPHRGVVREEARHA